MNFSEYINNRKNKINFSILQNYSADNLIPDLEDLANKIGVKGPILPPDFKLDWDGNIDNRDALKINSSGTVIQTLYKISDLIPSVDDLINGSGAIYVEGGYSTVPFKGFFDNDEIMTDEVTGEATFMVVKNTSFTLNPGIPDIQKAPSTGTYINPTFSYIQGSEKEGKMGNTAKEIIKYLKDNYNN